MKRILAVVLAAGAVATSSSTGHGTAEDTVAWEMAGLVAGSVRHIHDVPDDGTLLSLRWLTLTAGTNGGGSDAVFAVKRGGVVLCAVTVPCTSAAGVEVPADSEAPQSCDVALEDGDHLEVVPASPSGCATLPEGVLHGAFYYR